MFWLILSSIFLKFTIHLYGEGLVKNKDLQTFKKYQIQNYKKNDINTKKNTEIVKQKENVASLFSFFSVIRFIDILFVFSFI